MIRKNALNLTIFRDKPVVLYAVNSKRPLSKLPPGTIHIWTIPKVGSLSLFNTLTDCGVECAKFHHGLDWETMKSKSTQRIIDCVRDPMATSLSLMFHYLCVGKEHVNEHHYCSLEELKVKYTQNRNDLFDDLIKHFRRFYVDNKNHICYIMDRHLADLNEYIELTPQKLSEIVDEKYKIFRTKDKNNMVVHYFLMKCEYMNEADILDKLHTFLGNDSQFKYKYKAGHKTEERTVLGEIYKDFKQYIKQNLFSKNFLNKFYENSYAKIFYSQFEINQFKQFWRGKEDDVASPMPTPIPSPASCPSPLLTGSVSTSPFKPIQQQQQQQRSETPIMNENERAWQSSSSSKKKKKRKNKNN